jgi:hypothetical protein
MAGTGEKPHLDEEVGGYMSHWASFIEHLKNDVAQSALDTESIKLEFHGCSEAEIQEIMRVQRVSFLPEVYVQFMLQLGRGSSNPLWMTSPIFLSYPHLLRLNERWLSVRDTLGKGIFICGQAEDGVGFSYFHTNDKNPNPPVYFWNEDNIIYKIDRILSGTLIREFLPL